MSACVINPYAFARPWTPANITTALWLDAADTNTITLNGSNVSQWDDKSGNAWNASQATPSQQPAYQATGYNSRPTLSFDGSNDSLVTSLAGFFPLTIGIVIKDNGASGGVRGAIGTQATSPALGVLTASPSVNSFALWTPQINRGAYINNAQSTNNTLLVANANSIDESTWNIFVNGSNTGQTNETSGTPTAGGVFRIGYTNNAPEYWNGLISEVVVLNSYASGTTRQLIEGYLAWKWDLVASLPAAHPYKATPPTA